MNIRPLSLICQFLIIRFVFANNSSYEWLEQNPNRPLRPGETVIHSIIIQGAPFSDFERTYLWDVISLKGRVMDVAAFANKQNGLRVSWSIPPNFPPGKYNIRANVTSGPNIGSYINPTPMEITHPNTDDLQFHPCGLLPYVPCDKSTCTNVYWKAPLAGEIHYRDTSLFIDFDWRVPNFVQRSTLKPTIIAELVALSKFKYPVTSDIVKAVVGSSEIEKFRFGGVIDGSTMTDALNYYDDSAFAVRLRYQIVKNNSTRNVTEYGYPFFFESQPGDTVCPKFVASLPGYNLKSINKTSVSENSFIPAHLKSDVMHIAANGSLVFTIFVQVFLLFCLF